MKNAVIAALVAAVVAATSSTAATLVITSKDIKDGTIQTVDIGAKAKRALKGKRGPRGIAGLRGAQGPQGVAGTPGTQGPPGITNADEWFFLRNLVDPSTWLPIVNGTWPDVKPSMTRVMSVHLEKGNYVISTQVIVGNDSGQGVIVCVLGNDTLGYSAIQSSTGSAAGFARMQTGFAQDIFKMSEAGDLVLSCFNAPPNMPAGSPRIGYAAVIATRIDTATITRVE